MPALFHNENDAKLLAYTLVQASNKEWFLHKPSLTKDLNKIYYDVLYYSDSNKSDCGDYYISSTRKISIKRVPSDALMMKTSLKEWFWDGQ